MTLIETKHLEWFKQLFIQNGAPEDISDKQVKEALADLMILWLLLQGDGNRQK